MAEHKITGSSVLLEIDPAGGTDYDTVVCLTELTRADTRGIAEANSFCGPEKALGPLEVGERTFTGFHLMDPDTGKISGSSIRTLLYAGTTVGYRIGPVTPVDGDEVETGTAFVSNLGDTYTTDTDATFSGALQPYGTPAFAVTGS